MKTRTEIINRLINVYGYARYLEIGVENPAVNYDKIKCKYKIGVDPAARMPRITKLTSDDFFRSNRHLFDIIFIDGLHHSEQVIKDIDNALDCLLPNGTIVVHDCSPTSEIMQATPRKQGVWTGDVWRAWLHFRQRPDLFMCVLDTDYGVGVIRKGKQNPVGSEVLDYNYAFFAKNKKELLNLIPAEIPGIQVIIPAFEQYGKGAKMLAACLDSIIKQTGIKFDVLVNDNSTDFSIEKVLKDYPVVNRYDGDRGGSASINSLLNNIATNLTAYEHVKIMFQDDLLLTNTALADISFALMFDPWVISYGTGIDASGMPTSIRNPYFSNKILLGKNTIGMPSVIGHRRNDIRFDENLKTLLDCDYYYQTYEEFGAPGVIKKRLVGSRYWNYSTSRKQGSFIPEEVPYLKDKYQL